MFSKYFITIFILLSSAYAIECNSETRVKTDSGDLKVEHGKLEITYEDSQMVKLSTDTAQTSFNITFTSEKITSIISLAPDYNVGTLVTGEFDTNGQFKHSLVSPNYTSILTCHN